MKAIPAKIKDIQSVYKFIEPAYPKGEEIGICFLKIAEDDKISFFAGETKHGADEIYDACYYMTPEQFEGWYKMMTEFRDKLNKDKE